MKITNWFLVSVGLAVLVTVVYGFVLVFKASLLLGLLIFLVDPIPLILGLLGIFGHPEVAQKIATWLGM
jgi:hypothetical protein